MVIALIVVVLVVFLLFIFFLDQIKEMGAVKALITAITFHFGSIFASLSHLYDAIPV